MKITRDTKHRKDETCFKGEMIEIEFYKSADDVLDWNSNADNKKAATNDFFLRHHISKMKLKDK